MESKDCSREKKRNVKKWWSEVIKLGNASKHYECTLVTSPPLKKIGKGDLGLPEFFEGGAGSRGEFH